MPTPLYCPRLNRYKITNSEGKTLRAFQSDPPMVCGEFIEFWRDGERILFFSKHSDFLIIPLG